jgi:hypothetical protein
MPARAHRTTKTRRAQVMAYAAVGVPHHDIAKLQSISIHTLLKYYREELDLGKANATAQVAKTLFSQAIKGNVAAAIFWLKAQAGWRETPLPPAPLDPTMPGASVNILVGKGGVVVTAEEAAAVYVEMLGNPKASMKGITYEAPPSSN